MHTIFDFYY